MFGCPRNRVNFTYPNWHGGTACMCVKETLGGNQRSIAMRQISLRKVAIAASACTCAVLLSWNWSEQSGVSLSVDSAQAAYYGVRFAGRADRARFAARYGAAAYYGLGGV